MIDKAQRGGLSAFYEARFNSDSYALMAYCASEITAIAHDVGIEWDSIRDHISLNGGKYRGHIKPTEKRFNKKVMVWGDLKRSDQGFYYPQLTFNNNVASIGSTTWSGLSALFDLYKREGGNANSERHEAWLKRQAEQKAAREAQRAERERLEQEQLERQQRERNAYEMAWLRGGAYSFEYLSKNGTVRTDTVDVLGTENGTAPYLVKKEIQPIVQVVELKRMRDRLGEFTAVPLYNVHGEFGGLQRLYEDKKLQGTGVKMDGLHCVIGDLETAKRRYAAEGFATGASIYLAEASAGEDVAVVVTFSVGNLVKVLRAYEKHHPGYRFINAADNDRWTRAGNAGLLAALEIHRDMGHWAVLPIFEELVLDGVLSIEEVREAKPTDWNDYHTLAGLKATQKALRSRDNVLRAEKDYFEYTLQRITHSGDGAEKMALTAVAAGMMLVPIKYSTRNVVDAVIGRLPHSVEVNRFKIKSRAIWLAKQRMREARELRSFSPDALSRVQHIRLPGVRGEHGNTLLPNHIGDFVDSLEGFIIVRAPMGAGKTQDLIAPLMQSAPKAAYIAHRISLIGDAAYRLNIQHYQQVCAAEMPYVSHLACCVNSLTNPKFYNVDGRSWFSTLDTLCIDEASQVIRHTTTGPVDSPVRVMDALTEAMAAARRVLLCDADANDSVIELCEMASPGQPITVIEIEGPADHITIDHTDEESVWQRAIDLIAKGKRVLVANDSAESAKKMAAIIEQEAPNARMLLVHADSKANPAVEAFLDRPNEQAVNYDVLIYSPAISSGVSITTPHFQHHVGIFSGNTVSPSDAIQMLRRDRTARHYLVGIGHAKGQRETDREALFRGLVAADVIACEFEETTDEILLRRQKTIFDELYLTCRTSENRARNNFANTLLLMLYADGYKVRHVETDEGAVEASRKNKKLGGEIVFTKRLSLLQSVETPDDDTFARLNRQEIKSEAESAQIDRYSMVTQLAVEEINEEHVKFYDDRGIAKVAALELLQSTEQQARAYDRVQRDARVVLTKHRWKTPVRAFLVDMFETLGLDRFTGEGEFSSVQCREILARIMASQESVELYNALRVGRRIDPRAKRTCPTTVVKSVLENLGLSVHKRKSNGQHLFSISEESWTTLTAYVLRRAEKGIHSLETHESQTYHEPKAAPQLVQGTPDEASNGAASSDRDTLQNRDNTPDGKYPLQLREKIYAIASRFKPIGISLNAILSRLNPEIGRRIAEGMDGDDIRWTLEYAAEQLRKAGLGYEPSGTRNGS